MPYASWDKTRRLMSRLEPKIDWIGGRPHFEWRPVIYRDSRIDGGVYLSEEPREAIVVDVATSPLLANLYHATRDRYLRGERTPEAAVDVVFASVRKALPLGSGAADDVSRRCGFGPDEKVSIDIFLAERAGDCRIKALTTAEILELLSDERLVEGVPRVHRGHTPEGGHAWCNHTAANRYVIDAAVGYKGRLEDAPPELRELYDMPADPTFLRQIADELV